MGRRVLFLITMVLAAALVSPARAEDALRRRAYLGAGLSTPSSERAGAEVGQVTEGTAAAQAGLRTGDRILRINGALLSDPVSFERAYRPLRGGDRVTLEILREGQTIERTLTLPPMPEEDVPGVEVLYDSALTPQGYRVRTIVTHPRNPHGRLPSLFLAPWLSCGSVENPVAARRDGTDELFFRLAQQSGLATMRVERPGVGDSDGPPCIEVDFLTELAAFRAAFQAFKKYDFVDPDRIIVFGMSNGGGWAPLLAPDEKVAGYIVTGGWVKTWFEHMLEIERRRLRLTGDTPGEISRKLHGYAEFYTDYLIHQLTPAEVIRHKPHLAELWYDAPEHQYGRPAAYYQQLQALNLEAAWEKVNVPVLVMYGEQDWIMSRDDHERIAALVSDNRSGAGRFVVIAGADHGLFVHESQQQSFDDFWSGHFAEETVPLVLDWLKQQLGTR